jgi:hypothetical protein
MNYKWNFRFLAVQVHLDKALRNEKSNPITNLFTLPFLSYSLSGTQLDS